MSSPTSSDTRRRAFGWLFAGLVFAFVAALLVRFVAGQLEPHPGPEPSHSSSPTDTGAPSPTGTDGPGPTGSTTTTSSPEPTETESTPTGGPTSATSSPRPTPTTAVVLIVTVSGSDQSTDVRTAYAGRLVARVTNEAGTRLAGITVTFTAPGVGASAAFAAVGCTSGGGRSCDATTDSNGDATSSVLTANGTPGAFTVTGTTPNSTPSARFALTNGAPFNIELGAATPSLFPGAKPSIIPVTLHNPNPFTIYVTSLRLAAHNASCNPSTNIAIRQIELGTAGTPGRLMVPAHANVILPTQGVARPTIQLVDLPYDQTPTCAGQVFTLTASGVAVP